MPSPPMLVYTYTKPFHIVWHANNIIFDTHSLFMALLAALDERATSSDVGAGARELMIFPIK